MERTWLDDVCEQYVHDKHLPDYEEEEEEEKMNTRKNGEWDIIVAVPLDPGVEVVIGDRHTDFEPYVVWWCYNGKDYRDGAYIQEYMDAAKELARRIMPISEAHRIGELNNFGEQCDEVIPYIADDEGYENAKRLYKNNYAFRQKVAEAYGKYWYEYLDDNTSDAKFDCVMDALSKAYEEWKEE